ncbi:phosphodiester glycosidase family protein [Sphingobacterium sp. SGG-5]|uniref:phosphodiester glycosidase family protein n=1 Tax=Sphingobacterium sp. SGG-5 TaxID=2710881 RepID=UPI0013ECE0CF|nr:phosphodiester glycosidase family protein [Sphingobacterium sp. SGG-5]NGM60804.1 phosphodiester glycosidase family protein [Sphingobacterium sp. SGG-5]
MYALVFDPVNVEFKPVISSTAKKVSQFFNDESGDVYAVTNGGYFGVGVSYSLVRWNGETSADNIRALNRNYQGVPTTYYPTRAAFGLDIQNKPSVEWVYTVNQAGGPLYSYPQPSPNVEGSEPQPIPSSSFPSGGSVWEVKSAIGGSPVLVKNGLVKITDAEELISVDNTSSRARTAIGYLENDLVVLLVAEGGNTSESIPGLTLQDVAVQMKDMGCVSVINLDGGGSSAMVVKNNHTIKPSDVVGERAVISALVIKKK